MMNWNIPALCRCFITKQFAFPPRTIFKAQTIRTLAQPYWLQWAGRWPARVSGLCESRKLQHQLVPRLVLSITCAFYFPLFYREVLTKPQLSGRRGRPRCWNAATAPRGHCTHLAPSLCQLFSCLLADSWQKPRNAGMDNPTLHVGTEPWVHTASKWQDGGWRCKKQGGLPLDPVALPTALWYVHLKAPLPEAGPGFGIINNNLQGVFPKELKNLSMYIYNLGRTCLGQPSSLTILPFKSWLKVYTPF